jgi:hypothetical protein
VRRTRIRAGSAASAAVVAARTGPAAPIRSVLTYDARAAILDASETVHQVCPASTICQAASATIAASGSATNNSTAAWPRSLRNRFRPLLDTGTILPGQQLRIKTDMPRHGKKGVKSIGVGD